MGYWDIGILKYGDICGECLLWLRDFNGEEMDAR